MVNWFQCLLCPTEGICRVPGFDMSITLLKRERDVVYSVGLVGWDYQKVIGLWPTSALCMSNRC